MQLTILVSDPAVALTEGVGKVRVPFHQDFKAAWAIAWLDTVQGGGDPVIVEVSQDETIFSATIENDANESDVSEGGLITRGFASVDVPQVGNGTAKGLWLTIGGEYMPCSAVSPEDPLEEEEVLVDRTVGTHFGNAISSFPVSKAFDGVTNAAGANCAAKSGSPLYIGTTWSSAKKISKAIVYGRNESDGFGHIGSASIKLYGKNGTPSNETDGTLLATLNFTNTANESAGREVVVGTPVAYTSVWALIDVGSFSAYCAELVLHELVT